MTNESSINYDNVFVIFIKQKQIAALIKRKTKCKLFQAQAQNPCLVCKIPVWWFLIVWPANTTNTNFPET